MQSSAAGMCMHSSGRNCTCAANCADAHAQFLLELCICTHRFVVLTTLRSALDCAPATMLLKPCLKGCMWGLGKTSTPGYSLDPLRIRTFFFSDWAFYCRSICEAGRHQTLWILSLFFSLLSHHHAWWCSTRICSQCFQLRQWGPQQTFAPPREEGVINVIWTISDQPCQPHKPCNNLTNHPTMAHDFWRSHIPQVLHQMQNFFFIIDFF